jgi:hypothetical protein
LPEAAVDAWKTVVVSTNQQRPLRKNSSIILRCEITIVLNKIEFVNYQRKMLRSNILHNPGPEIFLGVAKHSTPTSSKMRVQEAGRHSGRVPLTFPKQTV